LSEKIGYWRYITIYRHLEKNPQSRVYPIFRFFESWCQDENRHGDFFAAVLKSQPELLNGWKARLWCRFFLLSVFATMYLNDLQRSNFYNQIGLEAKKFDIHVIRKTNQSSGRLFPIILDVDHPSFFENLEICAQANLELIKIDTSKQLNFVNLLQKLPKYGILIFYLLQLFLLKPLPCQEK